MDRKVEILLNSQKNIDSVNVDTYTRVELKNQPAEINEYDIRNVLSATEIFDIERNDTQIYRIYGKFEYMSILNGLKTGNSIGYKEFQDFFTPQLLNSKNILNSFDFYLVRPASSGYTQITGIAGGINAFIRYFEVIATPKDLDLYPIGFSNNVFNEQGFTFNLNIDTDISNYFDQFGFPVTELFLYAQYKTGVNGYNQSEGLSATTWNNAGVASKLVMNATTLNVGDYIKTGTNVRIGDVIEYSRIEYLQENYAPQSFYISTPYKINNVTNKRLIWKYNPLIPLRLRYLSSDLYGANISGTSYEQTTSIPNYATEYPIDTGNYVWREIMSEGYVDPLTGIGTDHPFVNKRRYYFSTIVFGIMPDLNDNETRIAFSDVWFTQNVLTINRVPRGNINNVGKPCL